MPTHSLLVSLPPGYQQHTFSNLEALEKTAQEVLDNLNTTDNGNQYIAITNLPNHAQSPSRRHRHRQTERHPLPLLLRGNNRAAQDHPIIRTRKPRRCIQHKADTHVRPHGRSRNRDRLG
ncbi:hypothetical protein AWENTII_003444 [Aspergillus wentii]|nr:hypothetical protein MW887_011899 [Aspergillus wentii]